MGGLLALASERLHDAQTAVNAGTATACRGYAALGADIGITSTAQVNFEATANGTANWRAIVGAPFGGTAASVSATASGLYRFNVSALDFWRANIATISVGNVTVDILKQSGGTAEVPSSSGGDSVTQGGGFDVRLIASTPTIGFVGGDVRLIASTPTIGNVGQGGAFDVRLIASTPTIGSVNIGAATVTQTIGTNLQAAANQAGTWDVRLIASTPTIGTTTVAQGGNTWTVQQGSAPWSVTGLPDVRLIASTPTIGGVNATQTGGWDVRLIAGTATAATVTSVNQKSATPPAINTVSLGTFASPTFAANTSRKSFWVQNVGTRVVYLGLGATPSATAYHFALASGTLAHSGNGGIYFDSEWVGTVTAIADAATGTYTYGETV